MTFHRVGFQPFPLSQLLSISERLKSPSIHKAESGWLHLIADTNRSHYLMVGSIQSKQQEVVGLEIGFGKPLFYRMFQLIAHYRREQYFEMHQKHLQGWWRILA